MSKPRGRLVAALAIVALAFVGSTPLAGATPAKTSPKFLGTYAFYGNVDNSGWNFVADGTLDADGTVTWTAPMTGDATQWSNTGRDVTIVIDQVVAVTLTGLRDKAGFDHLKHPGALTTDAGISGLWYAVRTA